MQVVLVELCVVAAHEGIAENKLVVVIVSIEAHLAFFVVAYFNEVVFWEPLRPIVVAILTL